VLICYFEIANDVEVFVCFHMTVFQERNTWIRHTDMASRKVARYCSILFLSQYYYSSCAGVSDGVHLIPPSYHRPNFKLFSHNKKALDGNTN